MPYDGSVWSSLEVAKLLIPLTGSLIIAALGYRISKQIEETRIAAERTKRSNDVLIQKRLSLYDDIGRKLNLLFSYYLYIGKWKEFSPTDVVKIKRELDEKIYTYQPFFTAEFLQRYRALEDEIFKPYAGWGRDTLLRTNCDQRQRFYEPADRSKIWDINWNDRFTNENRAQQIRLKYGHLISQLPHELNIEGITGNNARELPEREISNSEK